MVSSPSQHRKTREFGAVIEADDFRQSPFPPDRVEDPKHAQSGKHEVDLDGKHLSGEVVDQREDPYLPAIRKRVMDEIG